MKKLLMLPGPTPVSKDVLKVFSQQVKPHYGIEWKKRYEIITNKLKKILFTKHRPYVIPGSGTYVMEAAISSLLKKNDNVLICYNGYWAERLKEICLSYELKISFLKSNFKDPVNLSKLEKILSSKKKIKMVLFVHVETSTGLENPINEICSICSKYNVLSFVDSVGGLGGVKIQFDKMKIDILASSSQKCLNVPAGLGILFLSQKAKLIVKKNKFRSGWSLNLSNLNKYMKNWKSWHPHGPTTAPVSIFMALEKSIDNIIKERINKRFRRHLIIKNYVRKKIKNLGLKLFIENEEYASSVLTTFLLPSKIKLSYFINKMNKNYNILISGDLGFIDKHLVRIAHMGNSANFSYINKTLNAINRIINFK
jgi:aspartate aminotransferase-like enzyme